MKRILVAAVVAMALTACTPPDASEDLSAAESKAPAANCQSAPETVNPDPESIKSAEAILDACLKELGEAPEKAAKPQGDTFSDGTWRVGSEVKPGTYRVAAKTGCYWERMRGFGGDLLKDIISNGVSGSDGPVTVTIKPTDKGFKSQLCGTWKKV